MSALAITQWTRLLWQHSMRAPFGGENIYIGILFFTAAHCLTGTDPFHVTCSCKRICYVTCYAYTKDALKNHPANFWEVYSEEILGMPFFLSVQTQLKPCDVSLWIITACAQKSAIIIIWRSYLQFTVVLLAKCHWLVSGCQGRGKRISVYFTKYLRDCPWIPFSGSSHSIALFCMWSKKKKV